MSKLTTPEAVIDALEKLYAEAVEAQADALNTFLREGTPPDPELRASGAFCYPQIRIVYNPDGPAPRISRSYGRISEPGTYISTFTRPDFFRPYLVEQLTPLLKYYEIEVFVERSQSEMPYAYVWEQGQASGLEEISPAELARHFPSPDLAEIGDEVADGELYEPFTERPLALFDALRTDFSLKRLQHYTGTPVEHFQHYILFTNYHRYVDAFCDWGLEQLGNGSRYTSLSVPGGLEITQPTANSRAEIDASPWRRSQMPAYHLRRKDGQGITMVNIGVGPSNAKTITDHLAVLRPQCWIMVGHCAGLRNTQALGDFVLAHAYLREDKVLDDDLPVWVPIPALAEIQVALEDAVEAETELQGYDLKRIMRTGTVASHDNRNWELRHSELSRRFSQSRAIAVDMESATIAANGYRFRVPYGTLLCVSDKPLHGELKLPGMASEFYQTQVARHLQIGIRAMEQLRSMPLERLHSRKLRSFDETAFL